MTRRFLWLGLVPLLAGLLASSSTVRAYQTKETASGHPVRWDRTTVRFHVDTSMHRLLPGTDVERAIRFAAAAWRGFPGVPRIVIEEGPAPPLGREGTRTSNGIYAPARWPHAPHRVATTVTSYDTRGHLIDVDILINRHQPFALLDERAEANGGHGRRPDTPSTGKADRAAPRDDPYDLANVLTHELGHALGLDEATEVPEATMWPRMTRGETHKRTLAADDERGIMRLYEDAGTGSPAGCGGASVTGGTGAPPLLSLIVGLAALGWMRRRRPASRSVRSRRPR